MLDAIVIGNDHYNTLNVIRALGQDNIRVYAVIQTKSLKSFVLKSKYIFKGYIVTELNTSWLIENLSNFNKKIPIIASGDSIASFLDLNYDSLNTHFIIPSVKNTQGCLTNLMDKNIQLLYAKKAGFDTPASISIINNNSVINNLGSIKFPCIIKPEESIGGSKNDFRVCKNLEELRNELENLPVHLTRVLVQDYIPKDEEVVIAGVRTLDGKNYIFGEIKKEKYGIRLNNLGLTCLGSLQLTSRISDNCKRLVDNIDFHGCYSIEVIRSKVNSNDSLSIRDFFMEINFRTDATTCIYTKANINFPSLWVKSCYGEEIKVNPSKKIIYGMNEFLYLKNRPYRLMDFIKTDVFSTFSVKDIKPFIFRFIYHG